MRIKLDTVWVVKLVAQARAHSGLTRSAFAERVGTSRTRLSAYEHGHTDPELGTLERIAAAADLEVGLLPRGAARVRKQFDQIRRAADSGDRAWALRLIAELTAWVRSGEVHASVLATDPGLLGDRRWDALIGGVAEMLCHELDQPVPGWASAPARFADRVWFFSSLRSLWPHILITTPAAIASRGVFLSAESLASV